jgi:dTDP-4-amino-4,6-dideoxy-D-glucose acyltransferase
MQNIYDFFKTDKKALIFSKFRSGKKLSFKDYCWLFKDAVLNDLPKAFLLGFPSGIGSYMRYTYFKRKLKKIGINSILGKNLNISGEKNIEIGSYTWVDDYVTLTAAFGEIKIGDRVHVSPNSILSGGGGLYIDDFVGIASYVQIYSHSEVPAKGKSMAGPMMEESEKGFKSLPVHLQKNCFISAGAIILPGVSIGEGSVVGANSVVTKNVEPWTIVMGSPAKKIGRRRK